MSDDMPLQVDVNSLVLAQLPADQCIHGWTVVPTGDVVVFLIDRTLQQAVAPFFAAAGLPRLGCGTSLVFEQRGNTWEQISVGSWGLGPGKLLRTFEVAAREQPRLAWHAGIRLCHRWLGWNDQSVSQTEVDEMLTEFAAQPDTDPIWHEMERQFKSWAQLRGFNVRDTIRDSCSQTADDTLA